MNPPSQPQIAWVNQQYPHVTPGVSSNPTGPNGKLWGANVRSSMGAIQIVCGLLEIAFGIAVICVPVYRYSYGFDRTDKAGWGIWNGVFAIVTGFLGVYSSKNKCMVIAYMVCSIIAAVLCSGCCIYAGIGASWGAYTYYNRAANMAMYIILCITFFVQMVISIIGASFTCNAVCHSTNQSQQVVYYTPQPLPQQYVPTPPYNVVVS